LPTAVEPVKESFRITVCSQSSRPMPAASFDGTMLSTPAGMPACRASSAIASAVSGVSSEGLTTMVQPAASAAAALRVIIASGKFQGVMAAQTPIGCFNTMKRRSRPADGMTSA